MGESHRSAPATNDADINKPIWFHARKVNHGSYFLNKTSYGAVVFVDLEKAYNKIPRNVMWWALDKHKVLTKYVGLIKDMYNNAVTSVRTSDEDTDDFPIRIGLHQGLALSHYLFALVIDEVTRDIQGDIPWCMLFADDVVLVDESQTGVNQKTGVIAEDFGVQRF